MLQYIVRMFPHDHKMAATALGNTFLHDKNQKQEEGEWGR